MRRKRVRNRIVGGSTVRVSLSSAFPILSFFSFFYCVIRILAFKYSTVKADNRLISCRWICDEPQEVGGRGTLRACPLYITNPSDGRFSCARAVQRPRASFLRRIHRDPACTTYFGISPYGRLQSPLWALIPRLWFSAIYPPFYSFFF